MAALPPSGVPSDMPFRLVGTVGGTERRWLLADGSHRIGADSGCELCLDHPTVSRHHAELEVAGRRLTIHDRGSRNGTYVDGSRVAEAVLHPGAELGFGQVRLVLEELTDDEVTLGVELTPPSTAAPARPPTPQPTTVGLRSTDAVLMQILPELLRRAEAGDDELRLAQEAAAALYEHLPASRVEVRAAGDGGGLLFVAERELAPEPHTAPLEAVGTELVLRLVLPQARLAEVLRPVFAGLGSLLRLAGGRRPVPAPPAPPPERPALPAPRTVVPEVRRLYEEAARVAAGDVGVLISGESGTGKEVLARYLHAASRRSEGPFVALNCAALPRDLLESELFGIERGVATGVDPRPGRFELAHDGTLFLDEVADMTLETQARLLRVLQEGVVYRLGGSRSRPARCRIVAASNRDLGQLRASGAFREDLYFRIAVWSVELPPLRRRRADIPNLAAHFLQRAAERRGVRVRGITTGALELLTRYPWPGNIRQLENEMARAALFLADGEALESSRLGPEIAAGGDLATGGTLEERLARAERAEILAAFRRCDGIASAVAEELGIGRSTLYRRLKALGLETELGRT